MSLVLRALLLNIILCSRAILPSGRAWVFVALLQRLLLVDMVRRISSKTVGDEYAERDCSSISGVDVNNLDRKWLTQEQRQDAPAGLFHCGRW